MKQNTSEWYQARCGKITASEVVNVLSFLKRSGEETQARANYKAQIVAERLTGVPDMGGYLSPYMEHGNEYEAMARTEYELKTGHSVEEIGFVVHPDMPYFGASPDGLIGDDGGLELKCPKTETHLKYLLADVIPEEYLPQMTAGLSCTGREWWDFASFDPRLPEALQLFTKRLYRPMTPIVAIEKQINQFNDEVNEIIERLRSIAGDFELPAQMQPKQMDENCLTEEDLKII